MLQTIEKKYGPYRLNGPEEQWLHYFVNTYIGGIDVLGREHRALYDFR